MDKPVVLGMSLAALPQRLRKVPPVMGSAYSVFGPTSYLGVVHEPAEIAKLLAGDRRTCCVPGKHRGGTVHLEDLDAWLCIAQRFSIRNYLSTSFLVVRRSLSGKYYDFRTSRFVRVHMLSTDKERPSRRPSSRGTRRAAIAAQSPVGRRRTARVTQGEAQATPRSSVRPENEP